jgi:hypothetical protein
MLRIPHCVDNRLTDGSKVVSPTRHFGTIKLVLDRPQFSLFHCWALQDGEGQKTELLGSLLHPSEIPPITGPFSMGLKITQFEGRGFCELWASQRLFLLFLLTKLLAKEPEYSRK